MSWTFFQIWLRCKCSPSFLSPPPKWHANMQATYLKGRTDKPLFSTRIWLWGTLCFTHTYTGSTLLYTIVRIPYKRDICICMCRICIFCLCMADMCRDLNAVAPPAQPPTYPCSLQSHPLSPSLSLYPHHILRASPREKWLCHIFLGSFHIHRLFWCLQ